MSTDGTSGIENDVDGDDENVVSFEAFAITEQPIKRGRGRPRKDGQPNVATIRRNIESGIGNDRDNSESNSTANAETRPNSSSFRFAGVKSSAKRGRPKKVSSQEAANEMAGFLFLMIDTVSTTHLGQEAAFNPFEKMLIQPPLVRMLSRMAPETISKYGSILDPVVLAAGLGLWYTRVRTVGQRKNDRPRSETAPSDTTVPPGDVHSPAPPGGNDVSNANGYAPPPMALLMNWNRDDDNG